MGFLNVAQILISVVVILVILAQVKEGGGGQSTVRTRRGLEKTLFQFTIILSVVFLAVSIISVRLS